MSQAAVITPARPTVAATRAYQSVRIAFLDNLRYLMIVLVVLYHAVGAYAGAVAPYWFVHDNSSPAADVLRVILDTFTMPLVYFVAGYFALPSLLKKGVADFLRDKVVRLLVPWALCVLVVIPLVYYDLPDQPVRPFSSYWLSYLGSFETRLSTTSGPEQQSVYWFVSLLFAFFLLFALAHALMRRLGREAVITGVRMTSDGSRLRALVLFGALTSVLYFVSLLFFADSSWLTLSAFLQFQPTRLVGFAGCFALGIYAQSRGWFADLRPLGSISLWGAISLALLGVTLVTGQPLFAEAANPPSLPIGQLLVYAISRSFLLVSLLILLVSFGIRYWNRSSGVDRQLSATSYDIYLTHIWFVVVAQEGLLEWTGGPALAKMAIAFLVALGPSFAISKLVVGRYPRVVVAVILALFAFCLAIRA